MKVYMKLRGFVQRNASCSPKSNTETYLQTIIKSPLHFDK